MIAEAIARRVAELLAEAPPITPEQREQAIRLLVRPARRPYSPTAARAA